MKRSLLVLFLIPSFVLLFIPEALVRSSPQSFASTSIRFIPPPPPPDRSAPGGRGEGASRGCKTGESSLTAIVPSYGEADALQIWGLTIAERPSFWFYVPYEPGTIQAIEFVLQTDADETLYRSEVAIPSQAGLVKVQPEPGLEIGKKYHWFFKVKTLCAANQPVSLNYVEGWVQRQAPAAGFSDRLDTANPQQQARIYAENGIWYDALNTLAEAHFANPSEASLTQDWIDLLRSIGLEPIASQPQVE
jgi:Domain of Unknown Function (DUF928)